MSSDARVSTPPRPPEAIGPAVAPAWGSDLIADVLRALGLKHIALVPGSSFRGLHDSLVNHLGNTQPELLLCLHEEHAVAIADGYGKATERPMAVALHANVGLMHACMPIFNAWCDRTPMLIVGATGPVDAHKRRPWIDWVHTAKDQAALVRDYVKWDDQPVSPEAAVEALLRAYQIVTTRPFGPAYVCLDASLQEEALGKAVEVPAVERHAAAQSPAAPAETVDAALAMLKDARSPVVLLGRVSRDESDWDTRVALAETIGAPVLTGIQNPAAFPTEHPLHLLPVCGDRRSAAEQALISRADAILSFDWLDLAGFLRGASGSAQTQRPVDAKVIHCSLDGLMANGWSMDHQALAAVDLPVLAHPDRFAAQLLARIGDGGRWTPKPDRASSGRHWTQERAAPAEDGHSPIPLRAFAQAVGAFAAERDATLARLPISWPGNVCRFRGPLAYLGKDGGAAVGTGPGHTIGAALALKDSGRLVMGVLGDGDLLMGVNALWTAAHHKIPVLIVVANNQSYFNDELHQERVALTRGRPVENKWIGQRLDDPAIGIVGLARAQGFDGECVETLADLVAALKRGADSAAGGGQYLVDARVAPGYVEN